MSLPYLTGKACYRLVLRPPVGPMLIGQTSIIHQEKKCSYKRTQFSTTREISSNTCKLERFDITNGQNWRHCGHHYVCIIIIYACKLFITRNRMHKYYVILL